MIFLLRENTIPTFFVNSSRHLYSFLPLQSFHHFQNFDTVISNRGTFSLRKNQSLLIISRFWKNGVLIDQRFQLSMTYARYHLWILPRSILDLRNFMDHPTAFRSSIEICFSSIALLLFHSIYTLFKRVIEYLSLPLSFTKKRYIGYDEVTTSVEMSSDVSSAERVRFKEDVPRRNRKTFTIAAAATIAPGDGLECFASTFECRAVSNPTGILFREAGTPRCRTWRTIYMVNNVRLSLQQLQFDQVFPLDKNNFYPSEWRSINTIGLFRSAEQLHR